MKHILPGLGGLVLCLLTGCGRAPESGALDSSLSTFTRAKAQSAGSYSYDVPFGSYFGGGSDTKLVVKGERVVERSFTMTMAPGAPAGLGASESYDETGAAVGSHSDGAAAVRLEDLYAKCEDEVITQDRSKNDVFVTFGKDGILETCVYVPKGCQDDCSFGVEIREVKFGG